MALGLLVVSPTVAGAAAKSCVTGELEFAGDDLDDIATLKAQIDEVCVCGDFDSTPGKRHGHFVRCAKSLILPAVAAGDLRKQCKGAVIKIYAKSTCGLPPPSEPAKVKVPCIKKITRNGKVICAVKPENKCVDKPGVFAQVPCSSEEFCLDAADDNGNFLFLRDPTGGDDGLCATAPTLNARVSTGPADLIEGPLSRGRFGDLVLENEEIRVIIQVPQRNFSGAVGQFGGQIIDADLQRPEGEPGRDHFEEWSVMLNIENTAHYTDLVIVNDGSDGNPAIIRATGVDDLLDRINPSSAITDLGFVFPAGQDDQDLPIEITTDYILDSGDDFVQMDTTVTNVSLTETVDLFMGDFLSARAQEIFHPGYGFGEPLVTTEGTCVAAVFPCDFIAYAGVGATGGVSYGYIHTTPETTSFNTGGVSVVILGANASLILIGTLAPNFSLPPGESLSVTRYLAIGDGDVASIVDIRNTLTGLTTGTLQGDVTQDGAPVADVEIAVLSSGFAGPGTTTHVASQFRTDSAGHYEGTLPPGPYSLRAHKEGYLFGTPDPAPVTVIAAMTVTQDFTLAEPGRVRVTIVDENTAPIAGKVSVVGFDPSTDPGNSQLVLGLQEVNSGVFGDVTKDPMPFGLARVVFVDHSGDSGEFDLEPGSYQIVVSHGPEFSIHTESIVLVSGGSIVVNAQVVPVVDTLGFVSSDFHVHAIDSPDSDITRKDRIVSMLASGIDFFTPSDHEFRTDFADDLEDLGVESLISTAANNEVTPFDYGHFGGFPMTIDPALVNGGAIDWGREAPAGEDFPSLSAFGLTPGEIYDALQSDPGEDTVHIHHVASFFDGGLRFDTGVVPPESTADPIPLRLDPAVTNFWDPDFTAMEVWIGSSRNQMFGNFLGESAGNWFNLLNQGIVRTGFSDSDTHVLRNTQAGYPRSLVASPTDDPGALGAIAETLAINLNAGRVVGTNGPFLRVSVEGDTGNVAALDLGSPTLVPATAGAATVTVEIQSPTWAEFDTVEYYVNSETIADTTDRVGLPPLYRICPDFVQVAGVDADFTVATVAVNGAERLEAMTTLGLTGLTKDTWIVVMVRGTDGISEPLFPVIPNSLDAAGNTTLADLTDGNLGESGLPALGFSNPLFLDVDGNGDYDSPGLQFQGSCP